jgi:invasion protein IalB
MIWRSLACLVFGALAAPLAAQPADQRIATQGAWTVDCSAEPQTGEKWCEVGTALESLSPPYELHFNYVRDSHMFFARGSMSLSKVQAQVDGQPAFVLDRCLGGMCLIKGADAERLLAEMRAGKGLTLRFGSTGRQVGPIIVDLAAFNAMYQRALAGPR